MVCGSSGSIRPSRFFQSLGFTPAARTAIRTCPGPGCGSGRSTISRTSGPPNRLKRAAFIIRSDLGAGCAALAASILEPGPVEVAERCPVPVARRSVIGRVVGHGESVPGRVELDGVVDPGTGERTFQQCGLL